MKIFIKDSTSLTQPVLTNNFKQKCESISIRNCNSMNAKKLLDDVLAYQDVEIENGRKTERTIKRINIDLPYNSSTKQNEMSASYDYMLQYTSLSGVTDDGTEEDRPKLNGTLYLSVWVDTAMINNLQSKYDTEDLNIVTTGLSINWDDVAVQSMSSKDNAYNPSASLILNQYGYGTVVYNAPNFEGKYFITTSEARQIKNLGTIFQNKISVQDIDNIVTSDSSISYDFSSFNELSSFTGLRDIVNYAFRGCSKLTSIALPESLVNLGDYAFISCDNLVNVSLPSTLGKIGKGCFKDRTKITSMTLPSNLSSIGKSAFSGCNNLVLDVIPSKITTLADNVFLGCSKVKFTSIPSNLTEIGYAALSGCSQINIGSLPSKLQKIGDYAFSGLTGITISTIPESTVYIGSDAFNGCTGITISTIPESTVYIGSDAFNGCTGITSLTLENQNGNMTILPGAFDSTVGYPIYVGTEEDAWKSYNIKENYIHSSDLSSYSGRINSLYRKSYQSKIPSDYEIIDYVRSNGSDYLTTDYRMTDNTRFITDIGFTSTIKDTKAVHGSETIGFYSDGNNIKAKIAGSEYTMTDDSDVHKLEIDCVNRKLYLDDEQIATSDLKMNADNSDIVFLKGFMGNNWMNRIYVSGSLKADFIPVKCIDGTDNGKIGFYDVINRKFIGFENYTSDETVYTPKDNSGNDITDESGNVIVMM